MDELTTEQKLERAEFEVAQLSNVLNDAKAILGSRGEIRIELGALKQKCADYEAFCKSQAEQIKAATALAEKAMASHAELAQKIASLMPSMGGGQQKAARPPVWCSKHDGFHGEPACWQ